ncbi:4'-phosphopantetheinyl transferase family protein [Streptomyces sp. NPDC059496]|uniref:4'-phosphopantetheinyl transferase family protein n=1 Tax=Streptomyces sp. NPDC059496 TaxID=3346851 RepID=UPI0036A6CDF6
MTTAPPTAPPTAPATAAPLRTSPRSTLAARGTAVWWWPIPGTADPADLALLHPAERERMARFGSRTRVAEYVTSRAAVRRTLSLLLAVAPRSVELGRLRCPCCGDPEHGPPTLLHPVTPWWISISHTAGLGLLAVSGAPVGVDVERMRDVPAEDLSSVVFTASEREFLLAAPPGQERVTAFLRVWTRKEATLKAVGIGISSDLSSLETHPRFPGTTEVTAGLPGAPRTWRVTDLSLAGPWSAATAVAQCDETSGPVHLYRAPTPRGGRG